MQASNFKIEKISAEKELRICAKMMASSDPWRALYFTEAQCFGDLNSASLDIYGALAGQGVIGFLAAMPQGVGFEPMIEYLCVRENMRGHGTGSALIKHFEEILFPDADNLYLFTSDINPGARRLYARLGYAQIGTLPDFNLIGQTEFLYRKSRRPRQQKASQHK